MDPRIYPYLSEDLSIWIRGFIHMDPRIYSYLSEDLSIWIRGFIHIYPRIYPYGSETLLSMLKYIHAEDTKLQLLR